ncbi:rod shape-determining protein MreD [Chryseobacterium chendengshani]|uniref:rod shape-determining protein MreD n=1 Tax=Chryseobacterium sp. LJ756 TaxID=2864113 RepID=UPI001C63CDED|nr:rod shape-determining protein MreD [Chryseobacterium sp. LJ756]MBW7675471.1 rod shape-determining protein MreD [Chryseobacterium sp. LJ756]
MISRTLFTDLLIMIFLVALQIYVLNKITLFGKYTPVLYPVFVMFYPFFRNKFQFLALSFLIGLSIDTVMHSGGYNAFATTLIAYFRTLIFRSSTDTSTDFFSFQSLQWTQFFLFLFSSIFLHQLFVQYLEFFKLSRVFEILLNVLVTSVISFIFIIIYALIFKIKQKV